LKDLRTVRDSLAARKRHPFIKADLFTQFSELMEEMEAELAKGKTAHATLVREDPIRERVTSIFDGRVGDPMTEDEFKKTCEEGAERYSKRIPPGFKDQDKPEPNCYGDFIIWVQLLEHATRLKRSVLFVTDDIKDTRSAFCGENLSVGSSAHWCRVSDGKRAGLRYR
jgi:hypothetical protein